MSGKTLPRVTTLIHPGALQTERIPEELIQKMMDRLLRRLVTSSKQNPRLSEILTLQEDERQRLRIAVERLSRHPVNWIAYGHNPEVSFMEQRVYLTETGRAAISKLVES